MRAPALLSHAHRPCVVQVPHVDGDLKSKGTAKNLEKYRCKSPYSSMVAVREQEIRAETADQSDDDAEILDGFDSEELTSLVTGVYEPVQAKGSTKRAPTTDFFASYKRWRRNFGAKCACAPGKCMPGRC